MSAYPASVLPTLATRCARSGARGGHPEVRATITGTDLCGPCHGRFPRVLADLVTFWPILTAAITKQPVRDYAKDRVSSSGTIDVAALWNPGATFALAEITDWAGFLLRTVLTQRPVGEGQAHAFTLDTPPRLALALMARWHTRWLTHYPTLGPSLLDDALRLKGLCEKALDTPSVRRVTLDAVFCQDVVAESEFGSVRCGGQLVGVLRPEDKTTPSVVLCSINPAHTRLPRKDWLLAHD